ncbi:hypothetical protein EVJ58_g6502 [Rhodofomes roseus]|uniref:Hydrophobin n=1 Tax=Rhodofomes roseus TaxID=34475 RepID=A0A4Y9Y7H2_9APHY|nr:hypothetical protein EVJ58_g6502 [Rhodofomes roseus]
MQFKLAVFTAVLAAVAVLAAPAAHLPACESSSTASWPESTTASSPWGPSSSSSAGWPTSSSSGTWPSAVSPSGSAASSATDAGAPEPTESSSAGSCNSGPVQCCKTTESSGNLSDGTTSLLGVLGINVSDLANDIGLNCASLVGGATCSSKTVCCQNNTFNGLIAIGCVPIDISL